MIKYVELTAPDASAFRQAKILSIECSEGDQIKEGDTLFRVQSGSHEINLPATKAGRVVEMIAAVHENITLSTALLLLETEVAGSTASKPINDADTEHKPEVNTESNVPKTNAAPEPAVKEETDAAHAAEKSATNTRKAKSNKKKAKATKNKTKKVVKKQHQQQSLDLLGNDESEQVEVQTQDEPAEVVLNQTPSAAPANNENLTPPSPVMSSSSNVEVTVPDIGTDSAKVIEILVSVGDTVSAEDPLITLESDKASMDVPSPHDGVVKAISVLVDQDISEGTLILELEASISDQANEAKPEAPVDVESAEPKVEKAQAPAPQASASGSIVDVRIPDIGGDSAKVIEVFVSVGDRVEVEDPLVTLESDKASMDVPSSAAGIIESIEVSIDQEVSEGTAVVTLKADAASSTNDAPAQAKTPSAVEKSAPAPKAVSEKATPSTPPAQEAPALQETNVASDTKSHASPSIRRFARELGVNLSLVTGSGRKSRITHDDVKGFVKGVINKPQSSAPAASSGSGIPAVPAQDFSKFGEIDIQPLNRIKRLTATNLHRSWLNVPHVTHNDESNINDLESFRKQLNAEYAQQNRGIKLSPLAFIVKAVVNGLRQYPQFNSSLDPSGENLIYKKYFNIGIAVETPGGLVVPVIKDADKKSVAEIAKEMGELAAKARDKKLSMNDMSGACFTISSLGGIGGTSFTPIVNAPEVAILGVSRSKIQPVWNGSEFEPGMILPLSLSYDHRVIDGAEAARFTRHIAAVLEDVRRLTV